MIHFVLHDKSDSVAVVVVEGVKAGMKLKGWIMDEDKMTSVTARQDIPIGHKVALKKMAVGDTVVKYGIDMGKVVQRQDDDVVAHAHAAVLAPVAEERGLLRNDGHESILQNYVLCASAGVASGAEARRKPQPGSLPGEELQRRISVAQ